MSELIQPSSDIPEIMVTLRLVPVEVFTGLCDHVNCDHPAGPEHLGYGISDAVSAWSDCNRAIGRIYRVEDIDGLHREPGDTVEIQVRQTDLPFFERIFGEDGP